MDSETRAHFVEQMHKTQKEFDKLKTVVLEAADSKLPQGFGPDKADDNARLQEEDLVIEDLDNIPISDSKQKGFPIKCDVCGRPDTVPFEPKHASKLLCKNCFKARNGARN